MEPGRRSRSTPGRVQRSSHLKRRLSQARRIWCVACDRAAPRGRRLPERDRSARAQTIRSRCSRRWGVSGVGSARFPRAGWRFVRNMLPSMRVDEPILSIVATRRSAESRSGAIRPMARQAPLNSSIAAISDKIAGVISSELVSMAPAIFPSNYTRLVCNTDIRFSTH